MIKKMIFVFILTSFIFFSSTFVSSQYVTNESIDFISKKDKIWFDSNPDNLPIWLTSEELNHLDEIGKGFERTNPPPAPVRMPAEFEPMQGVLIRYPFGISYQIIAEMSEDVEVVTVVASNSEKNYVISQYQSNGVNLNSCDFLIAPSDSYWTRDYGPWFIFNGNNEQGIVDHIYNRPRPNDDAIPIAFGNWQGIPVYGLSLEHSGGNYMTDGQGIAVSTDLVWSENSGYSHEQINQLMQDYCGIHTYHVVPDALGDYIKHIDCWAKYLSPDTIMIIKSSPSHLHYEDFEDAVEYFENQTNCYGTPYNIVRVYTHMNEPYINSLILNNKVLLPITGSQWDDDAIESYENALPGYEVLGFTGSWQSTDALHCRAKGIVDRFMLYIEHTPLFGTQTTHDGYEINAKIIPYSEENLISSSTGIYWKVEGESWDFIKIENLGNDEYRAVIPPQETGTVIYYYIHAKDYSGRIENHPYIGASMAYNFISQFDNNQPQIINIDGPATGKPGVEYEFCIDAMDPDGDDIYIYWDWGDGETSGWISENCTSHIWNEAGTYTIGVKVKDEFGAETPWTELQLEIQKSKIIINQFLTNFSKFFDNYIKFLIIL